MLKGGFDIAIVLNRRALVAIDNEIRSVHLVTEGRFDRVDEGDVRQGIIGEGAGDAARG